MAAGSFWFWYLNTNAFYLPQIFCKDNTLQHFGHTLRVSWCLMTSLLSCLNWILHTFHICRISLGNSMIYSDIWHKYHEWYFETVIRNLTRLMAREIWDNFEIPQLVFMPNITKKHAIICLYYYPHRFVIFTCRYFKLCWNTTALGQSNWRNQSCSSISIGNSMICSDIWHTYQEWYFKIVIRNFTSR